MQKRVEGEWRDECRQIYAGYSVYHQSAGAEQTVVTSEGLLGRSHVLVENLTKDAGLAEGGRLLDVGCGNGAFLRAFSKVRPGWELHATEWDNRAAGALSSIPGFRALHVGAAQTLPGGFNLISAIHVIEHMEDPVSFITALQSKLVEDGALFIQVPAHQRNAFELLTADHLVHFSLQTIEGLLGVSGFRVDTLHTGWIGKEISAICRPGAVADISQVDVRPIIDGLTGQVAELSRVAARIRRLNADCPALGLFGTSVAGIWAASLLDDAGPAFFVDEDRDRIGREMMGRPIISPDQVPAGATVVIPLSPELARSIQGRLDSPTRRYVLP